MKRLILILTLVLTQVAPPVWAVTPDEVLDDPVLEARARDISKGLRCVVCRGENIDESNAGIAKDMRILVRELLTEGKTNDEVVAFMVERYGEFVLMRPTTEGANKLLWAAGPVLFFLALIIAGMWLRGRQNAKGPGEAALSPEERARLDELIKS